MFQYADINKGGHRIVFVYIKKERTSQKIFLEVSKKMKRLMKVLEFSTRWYDLPVFFFILLYNAYLVYRLLTSFRSCLFISAVFPISFPPSTPLIHHIPCLMFKVKQFSEIISFRRVRFCQRRKKLFIKFDYNWAASIYIPNYNQQDATFLD